MNIECARQAWCLVLRVTLSNLVWLATLCGFKKKEVFIMKKVFNILVVALIAVIGFSLVTCDNGNGGSGGDGGGANSGGNSIIGKWYSNVSASIPIYEFTSD